MKPTLLSRLISLILVVGLVGDPMTVMGCVGAGHPCLPAGRQACPKSRSIGWNGIPIAGGGSAPPLQLFASQALAPVSTQALMPLDSAEQDVTRDASHQLALADPAVASEEESLAQQRIDSIAKEVSVSMAGLSDHEKHVVEAIRSGCKTLDAIVSRLKSQPNDASSFSKLKFLRHYVRTWVRRIAMKMREEMERTARNQTPWEQRPIEDLGLDTQTCNVLRSPPGIETVGALCEISAQELLLTKRLGSERIKTVQDRLWRTGHTLKVATRGELQDLLKNARVPEAFLPAALNVLDDSLLRGLPIIVRVSEDNQSVFLVATRVDDHTRIRQVRGFALRAEQAGDTQNSYSIGFIRSGSIISPNITQQRGEAEDADSFPDAVTTYLNKTFYDGSYIEERWGWFRDYRREFHLGPPALEPAAKPAPARKDPARGSVPSSESRATRRSAPSPAVAAAAPAAPPKTETRGHPLLLPPSFEVVDRAKREGVTFKYLSFENLNALAEEPRRKALHSIETWIRIRPTEGEEPRFPDLLPTARKALEDPGLLKGPDEQMIHRLSRMRFAVSPEGNVEGVLYLGFPAPTIANLEIHRPNLDQQPRYQLLGPGFLFKALEEAEKQPRPAEFAGQPFGLINLEPNMQEYIRGVLQEDPGKPWAGEFFPLRRLYSGDVKQLKENYPKDLASARERLAAGPAAFLHDGTAQGLVEYTLLLGMVVVGIVAVAGVLFAGFHPDTLLHLHPVSLHQIAVAAIVVVSALLFGMVAGQSDTPHGPASEGRELSDSIVVEQNVAMRFSPEFKVAFDKESIGGWPGPAHIQLNFLFKPDGTIVAFGNIQEFNDRIYRVQMTEKLLEGHFLIQFPSDLIDVLILPDHFPIRAKRRLVQTVFEANRKQLQKLRERSPAGLPQPAPAGLAAGVQPDLGKELLDLRDFFDAALLVAEALVHTDNVQMVKELLWAACPILQRIKDAGGFQSLPDVEDLLQIVACGIEAALWRPELGFWLRDPIIQELTKGREILVREIERQLGPDLQSQAVPAADGPSSKRRGDREDHSFRHGLIFLIAAFGSLTLWAGRAARASDLPASASTPYTISAQELADRLSPERLSADTHQLKKLTDEWWIVQSRLNIKRSDLLGKNGGNVIVDSVNDYRFLSSHISSPELVWLLSRSDALKIELIALFEELHKRGGLTEKQVKHLVKDAPVDLYNWKEKKAKKDHEHGGSSSLLRPGERRTEEAA